MGKKYFTKEHEWIEINNDQARVGVTHYAQEMMGDIVHVELPELNSQINREDEMGTIESVKAASELFAPISGEITAINEQLTETPELINEDAEGEAWICEIKVSNPAEVEQLLDQESYDKLTNE